MDDVGQTLLNWASAFGTQEMVKKKTHLAFIPLYSTLSFHSTIFLSAAERNTGLFRHESHHDFYNSRLLPAVAMPK